MSLAGRSSGEEPPTKTGQIHRSNPARGGEQFLVVRGVSLVYVREHRSNVRTIEQILFKYSPGDNAAERSWSRQFTLIVDFNQKIEGAILTEEFQFKTASTCTTYEGWRAVAKEELIPAVAQHFAAQGDRTLGIGDTALFQAGNAPRFIRIS
ncbi:unnamed protein product [Sphagnum balticum]